MKNVKVQFITRTAILLALTLVVQMIGLPQPVTGPLVNLILIVSVFFVGVWGGVTIGLLTPWIALSRGILPPLLAGVVPFIMLANILYVVIFNQVKKINTYLALVVASVVKFSTLALAVQFVVQVKPAIAKAMQLPQLVNAMIGGFAAIIIVEILAKTKAFEHIKD